MQGRFNKMNDTKEAKMEEIDQLKAPERKAQFAVRKLDKEAAQLHAVYTDAMKEVQRVQGDRSARTGTPRRVALGVAFLQQDTHRPPADA